MTAMPDQRQVREGPLFKHATDQLMSCSTGCAAALEVYRVLQVVLLKPSVKNI